MLLASSGSSSSSGGGSGGGGGGGGSGSGGGAAAAASGVAAAAGGGAAAAAAGGMTYVHVWSDGCGAQLKSRWQLAWLLCHGLPGVSIIHNYFQSCHGKGPSDSEGAAVKNHYRHVEHQQRRELNTTGELVAECRGHMQIGRLGSL